VYDELGAACSALPVDVYSMLSQTLSVTLSGPGYAASVTNPMMGHDAQALAGCTCQVFAANTLYCMKVCRAELLGLPVGMI